MCKARTIYLDTARQPTTVTTYRLASVLGCTAETAVSVSTTMLEVLCWNLAERLDVGTRSGNCLRDARINYVWQIIVKSEKEMLKETKNFGKVSLKEVKEHLAGLGLRFGMRLSTALKVELSRRLGMAIPIHPSDPSEESAAQLRRIEAHLAVGSEEEFDRLIEALSRAAGKLAATVREDDIHGQVLVGILGDAEIVLRGTSWHEVNSSCAPAVMNALLAARAIAPRRR